MRTHSTLDKWNKINPNIPDICVKCNVKKGTLFHCLWDCPGVRKIWNEVNKCSRAILSVINLNPKDSMLNSKERK